ncbi:MAG TPA: hypothetical protein VGK46_08230 [Saprospiraceae bacterium]
MQPSQLEIIIDKIELEGFDRMSITGLKAAIEQHLLNKLNLPKLLETIPVSSRHDRIEGRPFAFHAKMHTTQIGESIAGSISQGLEQMQVKPTS